jgi:hypothetical protein
VLSRGSPGRSKLSDWKDLRNLLVRAHIQLGELVVLVWDNVRLHLTADMREFIAANAHCLTVFTSAHLRAGHQPTGGHLITGQA